MLAAWLISIVVVWPILWLFFAIACLFCVLAILTTLYPDLESPAVGMIMSFLYLPLVSVVAAFVTGIVCYKTCRYLTAPWRESGPLAFEIGALMTASIALLVACAFWACLAALMAVP